jgi:hypothetical protein
MSNRITKNYSRHSMHGNGSMPICRGMDYGTEYLVPGRLIESVFRVLEARIDLDLDLVLCFE